MMEVFASWTQGGQIFVVILLVLLTGCAMRISFRLINRVLRTIKVTARGWPPEHLDADGDWKPKPEDD